MKDKSMKQRRKLDSVLALVLSFMMVWTMIPGLFFTATVHAEAGGTPDHAKLLADNNDGTYKLALSVTGEAEKAVQHINVIVIVDRSGSMDSSSGTSEVTYTPNNNEGTTRYGTSKDNPNLHSDDDFFALTRYGYTNNYAYTYPSTGSTAYVPTNSTGNDTQYGLVNGEYVQLTRRGYTGNRYWTYGTNQTRYNGVRYSRLNNTAIYTGQRYTRASDNQTRMEATQAAVNSLANSLLSKNGDGDNPDDMVEMALVSFATTGSVHNLGGATKTTSYTTFSNAVNGLDADGGTNWESALQQANGINFGDNDQTFVIFFSDGSPTFHSSNGGYNNWNNTYNVYGSGQEQEPNMERSYTQATDDASSLATKVGVSNFYTIFAYGTTVGSGYMEDLTTAAGAPAGNNYSASNTTALQDAFDAILSKIELAGFAEVDITDGTTNKVSTTSGVVSLLEVDPTSFKYYRAGGTNSDGSVKYEPTDNSITPIEGETQNIGEEWKPTDDPAPPAATYTSAADGGSGAVDWDLSSLGVLENDVTYTVTFDVYPSQTAYDYIARIKNGDLKYADLPAEVKVYFNADGTLATNTEATLSYDDTRTDQEETPITYDNPDPVATEAETMSVSKKWENALDARKVGSIDMTVLMNGETFHNVTLTDPTWKQENIYIATGLMRTKADGTMQILDSGHDFTFAELGSEQYNWELVAPVMHPMIIDGTLTMLIMVDENHPAPTGAAKYTLNNKEYFVADEGVANLEAYNYRRSNLNLMKAVDGEDADPDQLFPFTLTVNNGKADDPASTDTSSDNYLWFSIFDTNAGATVMNATVRGEGLVGPASDGYYYIKSGKPISVSLKAGWNLRFINLPTDTTYTFTEGTLPRNYAYSSTSLVATYGSGDNATTSEGEDADSTFNPGQTTTGTIQETNTTYQVNFTNVYDLEDVEITKVWEDEGNQDGIRPSAEVFKTYLVLKAGGTDVTAANASKLTVTDNGNNTYTAKWTGLDRYSGGNEIVYTVEETEISGYTTTGSPASDHGTITNTHTPSVIDVPVEKIWDDADDQDGIRPASVTVNLLANGTAVEGKSLTLDKGNNWSGTFTGVPEKQNGQSITYTVEEVQEGVIDGDAATGYAVSYGKNKETGALTVTNTHTPELRGYLVSKAWEDGNDQDGKRPASIEVRLLKNGQEYKTVTLSDENNWQYEWSELPKYENGTAIAYTAEEDQVSGYDAPIYNHTGNGAERTRTDITNHRDVDKTQYTVKKVWADNNNQDGKRPDHVTVQLKDKNGKVYDTVRLDDSNSWQHTWTGLNVNEPIPDEVTDNEDASNSSSDERTAENNENETKSAALTEAAEAAEKTAAEKAEAAEAAKKAADEKAAAAEEAQKAADEAALNESEDAEALKAAAETAATEAADAKATAEKAAEEADAAKAAAEKAKADAAEAKAAAEKAADAAETKEAADAGSTKAATRGNETPIEYTVVETEVPDGYEVSYEESKGEDGFTIITITNTHIPETKSLVVTKVWEDASNQDGKRPAGVTFTVTGSDGKTYTASLTKPEGDTVNTWTATIENVAVYYDGGKVVTFTVDEDKVTGYSKTIDNPNLTITNSYTPETTDVSATKVWDDADNQDGKRDDVTFILNADGEPVAGQNKTISKSATGDDLTVKWTNLPVYKDGTAIIYTVVEDGVTNGKITMNGVEYSVTVEGNAESGFTITNSYTPETVKLSGEKTWKDNDNANNTRPPQIIITLMQKIGDAAEQAVRDADGNVVKQTVTAVEDGSWTYKFENLPKYAAQGVEIAYSIVENVLAEYTTVYSEVTKDKDGNFVADVTNTNVTIDTYTEAFFKKTVDTPNEVAAAEFSFSIEEVDADGKAIEGGWSGTGTATYAVGETGSKPIKFADNTKITYSEPGTHYYKITETNKPAGWTATPESVIVTVEVTLEGDELKAKVSGGEITNSYNVTPVEVKDFLLKSVEKMPPGVDSVVFNFELEGPKEDTEPVTATVTATKAGTYTINFADGTFRFTEPGKYSYVLTEVLDDLDGGWVVTGNPAEFTINVEDNGEGALVVKDLEEQTITNTFDTVEVTGVKTWNDGKYFDENDEPIGDYTRPAITINLSGKVDDEEVVSKSVELDGTADAAPAEGATEGYEDAAWSYKFVNLPKFANHGTLIEYSVTETDVNGFTNDVDGFNVINTPDEKKIVNNDEKGITIKKVDADTGAETGIAGAVFTLTDSEGTETTYTTGADGTVKILFEGYETEVNPKDEKVEEAKTSTYTLKETAAPAGYELNDTEYTITVKEELVSVKLNTSNVWEWLYNLISSASPDFKDGVLTVPDTPKKTKITVEKVWDDASDQDGKRAATEATVQLYKTPAGGEKVAVGDAESVVVSGTDSWSKVYENLPAYEDGKQLTYTVEETLKDDTYSKTIAPAGITADPAKADNGTIKVTNSYKPEETEVTVTKVWEDNDNQDGWQPEEVEVTLLADGAAVTQDGITAVQTLNEGNEWTYTWSGLNKNRDGGTAIVYTVAETETAVITGTDGEGTYSYEITGTQADGYKVTNTHTPETVEVKGVKTWNDDKYFDEDGNAIGDYARPKVTINLSGMAGEEEVVSKSVELDGTADEAPAAGAVEGYEDAAWSYKFVNLPKYNNGKQIEYSVTETDVNGFTEAVEGFEVINTPDEEKVVNDDKTGITIKKVDADTGAEVGIAGAEFTLTDSEGKTKTYTTGTDGTVKIDFKGYTTDTDVEKAKTSTYTLKETTAPAGYELNNTEYTITVKEELVSVKLKANVWEWLYNLISNTSPDFEDGVLTVPDTPKKTKITVEKAWDDASDQDGKRAATEATVQLYKTPAGGQKVAVGEPQSVVVSGTDSWSKVYENLPAYEDGKQLTYTVEETLKDDTYSKTIAPAGITADPAKADNGTITVTNTYEPEETTVEVVKVWNDNKDQDGERANVGAKMQLFKTVDGKKSAVDAEELIDVPADDGWSYTWENLPVYEGGKKISYSVEETLPADSTYTKSGDGELMEAVDGATETATVTNSHQSKPVKEGWTGTKETRIDGKTVEPGQKLNYSISYTNTTGETAETVKIIDKIPEHTKYVEGSAVPAEGASYDEATKTLTWTFSNVKDGDSKTVEFQVEVLDDKGEIITNTAEVQDGINEDGYESNPVTSSKPVKDVAKADAPTQSIDGQMVQKGDKLQYKLSYTNKDKEAVKVGFTDKIPKNTKFVSASTGGEYDEATGVITWPAVEVASGDPIEVTFIVEVLENDGKVIDNKGTAIVDGNEHDTNVTHNPVPKDPEKTVYTGENKTNIDGKPVEPGQVLTYEIKYENTTGKDAETVTITDTIPEHTTYEADSAKPADAVKYDEATKTLTWTFKDVKNGESRTVEFQVKVDDDNAPVIENKGNVNDGTNESGYDTNPVTNTKPVKDVFNADAPTQSIDGQMVQKGDKLQYKLSFTNEYKEAVEVGFTDKIPANTKFVSASDGGKYDEATGIITWEAKEVAAGDPIEVTFVVEVLENNGEVIDNTGTAIVDGNEYDTNVTHNPVPKEPEKEVWNGEKTVKIDDKAVLIGQILTYVIRYKNTTGGKAEVTISDEIPEHTTYVDGSATETGVFADGKVTWDFELEKDEEVEVSFQVKVNADVDGTNLVNRAEVIDGTNDITMETNPVENPTPRRLVIEKTLPDFVDHETDLDEGAYNYATFAFEITGTYTDENGETKQYRNTIGMDFSKKSDLTQSVTVEGIPGNIEGLQVEEIYSGNYDPDEIRPEVKLNEETGRYEVSFRNTKDNIDYKGGVVNHYDREGFNGSGETASGEVEE